MRKSLILLIVLLLASGIFTSYCAGQLYELRDQVTVTEKTILGDPAAAGGLRVTLKTTWDDHLFWTTTQTLGSGQEPETEYQFVESSSTSSYIYRNNGVEYYINYDMDASELIYSEDEVEFTGLAKAYKELYDSTQDTRRASKEVRIADYMDYYPLRVNFSILKKGFGLHEYYDSSSYDRYFSGASDAKYIFNDYFRIPVLEDETLTIHVSKESTGYPSSWGESNNSDSDWYYPETYSVLTDDTCFFTISLRSQLHDTPLDASHLKDGYGIYSFRFDTAHDDKYASEYPVIDPYSFCNAYPLDPLSRILDFSESADKTSLHLLTEEHGTVWFTAIDQETLETKARISLAEVDDTTYSASMNYTEDFVAVFLHNLDKVAVISIDDAGSYQLEFVSDWVPDADHNLPLQPNVLAFDGKRLAITNSDYEYFGSSHYFAGYLLIIVDKDGVQYYGEYETSLNTGRNSNRSSWDYRVRHVDDDSLKLEWMNK